MAEFLTGAAHRGRVDDGQELLEVLGEDAIEERLVAIMERRQADVALEVVGLSPDMLQLERHLLLDDRDARGQEPAQAERVALRLGEGGALVQQRLPDEVAATLADHAAPARRFKVAWARRRRVHQPITRR